MLTWNIELATYQSPLFLVLVNGSIVSSENSTTSFTFEYPGSKIVFEGAFTVNGFGDITDGTITAFKVFDAGQLALDASGYQLSLEAFNDLLVALNNFQFDAITDVLTNDRMTVNGSEAGEEAFGGVHDDLMFGNGGDDFHNGYLGNDLMSGGAGNDELFGHDGADVVTGGEGNDILFGGDGNDKIKGGKGADLLYGQLGKDILAGGKGKDAYHFDAALGAGNIDKIKGFKPGPDSIVLHSNIFTALSEAAKAGEGSLDKDYFATGKAKDGNDFIIYKGGKLFYDGDGAKDEFAAVKFAKLKGAPDISAHDFLVFQAV